MDSSEAGAGSRAVLPWHVSWTWAASRRNFSTRRKVALTTGRDSLGCRRGVGYLALLTNLVFISVFSEPRNKLTTRGLLGRESAKAIEDHRGVDRLGEDFKLVALAHCFG